MYLDSRGVFATYTQFFCGFLDVLHFFGIIFEKEILRKCFQSPKGHFIQFDSLYFLRFFFFFFSNIKIDLLLHSSILCIHMGFVWVNVCPLKANDFDIKEVIVFDFVTITINYCKTILFEIFDEVLLIRNQLLEWR